MDHSIIITILLLWLVDAWMIQREREEEGWRGDTNGVLLQLLVVEMSALRRTRRAKTKEKREFHEQIQMIKFNGH
jgi:hypothetical protein